MAKTEERTEQEAAMEELLRELDAIPPGTMLTDEQVLAFTRRMPPLPADFTSADVIREARGPLPGDDQNG